MEEGQGRYIPKFLDAQPQFLWWEFDEAMILLAGLMSGIMLDNRIIFFSISIIVQRVYTKLKEAKQPGYLYHKLYSLGLTTMKSNSMKKNKIPDFYNKYFVK